MKRQETVIKVGGRTYKSIDEAMKAARRVGDNNTRAERVFDALSRLGRTDAARQARQRYSRDGFNSGTGISREEMDRHLAESRAFYADAVKARSGRLSLLNPKGQLTDILSYEDSLRNKARKSGVPADRKPTAAPQFGAGVEDRPLRSGITVVGGGGGVRGYGRSGTPSSTIIDATSTFTGGKNATIKDRGSVWHSGGGFGRLGFSGGGGTKVHVDPVAPKGGPYRNERGYYQGGEFLGTARDGSPVFTRKYDGTMSPVERDVRFHNDRAEREETIKRNAWIVGPEGMLAAAQRMLDREYARIAYAEASRQVQQMRALADLAALGYQVPAQDSPAPQPVVQQEDRGVADMVEAMTKDEREEVV